MKNNKGQTLVIFVIFLPIIILLFAFVIDVSIMYTENNKLNNINILAINYALENINDDNLEKSLNDLVKANDKNIQKINITIKDTSVKIIIEKNAKSLFGNVIGMQKYKIVSKYNGILKENKKIINKG